MKTILKIAVCFCTILFLYSCSSDDGGTNPPTNPNEKVTYDKDIKPIIEGRCFACHIDPPVNGAPFPLVNYNQVNSRASQILTAISKQSGTNGAMPPSGRLPQATIDLVEQWINDGALEN